MSARITLATAERVLLQLRHDPRTVALLVFVPCMLITLLELIYSDQPATFDRIGAPMVGLFPLLSMFLVTSITMLRERTTGTLERLMTLPLAKIDLLAGYALAFAVFAAVQATVVAGLAFLVLGLDVTGSPALVVMLAITNALLGMSLGLFTSAFARSEFQALQFMPAFLLPQLFLCGLFVPRNLMAPALEAVSWALPMTYAYDALSRVANEPTLGARGVLDVAVTLVAMGLSLVLAALTLRRRTD